MSKFCTIFYEHVFSTIFKTCSTQSNALITGEKYRPVPILCVGFFLVA